MVQNITFRSHLLGSVTDFCLETGLALINQPLPLVELIVLLARYKEEGTSLCPEVYLTNDLNLMVSILPDSEKLKIGTSTNDLVGIKKALKKCAPLASQGWLVYIAQIDTNIEFGLFRGASNPIAVKVDDALIDTNNKGLIVVKISQIAEECVEIKCSNDSAHYVYLDHRSEKTFPPNHYLEALVSTISQKIPINLKEVTENYLSRLLYEALRDSHGCLVAVTDKNNPPSFLSDAILLEEPINFPDLISKLQKGEVQPSVLDSKKALVKGMFNSDGIVIFDNKGRLIGYNCFVPIQKKNDVNGGARKRAFSELSSRIGKGLIAAFIRSQDGGTDYKDDKDEQ